MEHYIDKIEVRNEAIFGDKESRVLEMDFLDGYAISTDKEFGMSYPTIEEVKRTQWMQDEILAYCGDGRNGDFPFDIALKFGKLFILPMNAKLQRQVKYLEEFLQPEDQEGYQMFCKSLDHPEREYFVLYHDRTGDGGMAIDYLGVYENAYEASRTAFYKGSIPADHSREIVDVQRELMYEVVLQDDTKIDMAFVNTEEMSTEYWAIISRKVNPKEKYGVLVWNRDSKSNDVQNMFYVFDNKENMLECARKQKVAELSVSLEFFNDSWFCETLKGSFGLKLVECGMKNVNIWGYEGYNVHIISGTFK